MLAGAIFLIGCGGGSDGLPDESGSGGASGPTGATGMITYTTSVPLADNTNASAYKVLLMGNSHAAGLLATLKQLLILGEPGKSVDV